MFIHLFLSLSSLLGQLAWIQRHLLTRTVTRKFHQMSSHLCKYLHTHTHTHKHTHTHTHWCTHRSLLTVILLHSLTHTLAQTHMHSFSLVWVILIKHHHSSRGYEAKCNERLNDEKIDSTPASKWSLFSSSSSSSSYSSHVFFGHSNPIPKYFTESMELSELLFFSSVDSFTPGHCFAREGDQWWWLL